MACCGHSLSFNGWWWWSGIETKKSSFHKLQTRIIHVKIYALTHLTQSPNCMGMLSTWIFLFCFGLNIGENNHRAIISILWRRFHARVWMGIEQRARPLFHSNPEPLVLSLIWAWLPQLCPSKNTTVDKTKKKGQNVRRKKTNSPPPPQRVRRGESSFMFGQSQTVVTSMQLQAQLCSVTVQPEKWATPTICLCLTVTL